MTDEEEILQVHKRQSKYIRILVAIIYIGCVSGLGVALSIYYLFFWDSTMSSEYKLVRKKT